MRSQGLIATLTSMVRPFDLRDLALVRRLSERGVSLHTVSALADNLHPLRGALMSMLVGGDYPTLVWKAENGEGAGFIQLHVLSTSPHAFILYLSPASDSGARERAREESGCGVGQRRCLAGLTG